jgi:malate permease and related proteins
MDVAFIVLQSVLALLGIGVIGFWVTRRGIVPENALGFLSRLAIDIALPCMVFSSIMVNFSPEDLPGWWQLPLWWAVFAAFSLALTLLTSLISKKETRSEFAFNMFFQNGLFVPLVLISGIFGTDSPYLPQLYIFIIFHPVVFFSCYQLFFRNKSPQKVKWDRVFNPILISTVLAIILRLLGVNAYIPGFVYSILQNLGAMALPLIMLILGGSLYLDYKQKGKVFTGEIIKFLAIKNIIFPLVLLLLLVIFKPSYGIALLFIMQSAAPPITSTPIMTERAGGNKSISNQFVLTSFIFAVISIPAVFWLFSRYFPMP